MVRAGYAGMGDGDREARAVGTALNSRKARTISKSGLVLKRENHPFKNNITAEPPRRFASSHGSILEFIPFKISIPPDFSSNQRSGEPFSNSKFTGCN